MKIAGVIEELEESEKFREWKQKNRDSFLADAFLVVDPKKEHAWQLGYYTKGDSKVTVFKVEDSVHVSEPEEVFKEEKDKILEIKKEDVEIELDEALKISGNLIMEKYPNDNPLKTIVILQNIENKVLWNMTYLTSGYNAINIRIDAKSGEILEHKALPVFEFRKKE